MGSLTIENVMPTALVHAYGKCYDVPYPDLSFADVLPAVRQVCLYTLNNIYSCISNAIILRISDNKVLSIQTSALNFN